jgi:hypothetical protein
MVLRKMILNLSQNTTRFWQDVTSKINLDRHQLSTAAHSANSQLANHKLTASQRLDEDFL